jgi:iron complex outermembrane recepter protein
MNARSIRNTRAVLALFLGASLIPATVAQTTSNTAQSSDDDEAVKLEKFEVTGSRVKRVDAETTQPVLTISAADIELTGYSTVADALRSLPFNSGQSLTPVSSGTSFTPGLNSFNLRGLGNNNVLVLVNGRRAAPFGASGFNGLQTMFDLNSLPISAIESVELLKDGGSAIYGSDAVSGVINVKLKKSGNGANMTVSVGNTVETDSLEKSANFSFFTANGKTSVVFTADWQERNSIFARDLKFTSNADLRDIGGINRASTSAFPGLVFVPGIGYRTFVAPTTTPTAAAAVPLGTANGGAGAGFYNFLLDSDTFPATRQTGFYTRVDHELTSKLSMFGEFTFRRAETTNASAASPMFSTNEQGFNFRLRTAAELNGVTPDPTNRAHYDTARIIRPVGIVIPAYNPFNPWGVELASDNRVRFVPLGPRVNNVTSDSPRFLVGLKGDLDLINDTWTWESALNYSKSTYMNISTGGAQDMKVQEAFHGVTFGAGTPDAVTLFLNPFGPSDPRIINHISIRNPTTSSYQTRGWDVIAQGEIFNLPAGAVGLAVGGEFRDESLKDYRTALNEQGQIIGGSEGSSVIGFRDVYSAFAEVNIPVLNQIELQVAGRFEDYSDFGTTTKPKVSIKVQPFKDLIIRASYGESFLAPNLPYLYSTASTSFTAQAIIDPRRPGDPAGQIKQLGGGNPDLQPEETETKYIGFVYDVPFIKGLELSADYFVFDSTNLLTSFGAAQILAGEAANNPVFASLVVRNPPAPGQTVGTIQYVQTSWTNAATRKYKGSDFAAQYTFNTTNLGRFRFSASATYLEELSFGGFNSAGSNTIPRVRGNFSTSWQRGDWGASVFVNYIGHRYGTGQMSGTSIVTNTRYGSQVLVNPQVTYRGIARTRITVGARNVLDRDPPLDYGQAERWTAGVNNPEPLYLYVRVSRDF